MQRHKGNVQAACDDYFKLNSWDFTLPQITASSPLARHLPPSKRQELGIDSTSDTGYARYSHDDADSGFRLRDLIGAIQQGERCDIVRAYLTHFAETLGSATLKDRLNAPLDDCPGIFFVVDTGNVQMVKVSISYAGNTNHIYRTVPVLGFAIARCHSFRQDMPMVVKTMLSLGWSVDVIPRAFYEPLHRDLPDDGPVDGDLDDLEDEAKSWCIAPIRKRIAQALNFSFTIRYVLLSHPGTSSSREQTRSWLRSTRQVPCDAHPPAPRPALRRPQWPRKNGIGSQSWAIAGLDLHSVDCTNLRFESDLFGPWCPYQGWEKGSAVNNYLAGHNGQRCIIFMDEFEKTEDEVRQALLVPFQSGEYRDRRTLGSVNCSKTIWVLATNAFDQIIHGFCDSHRDELFGDYGSKAAEETIKKLGRQLTRKIQKESIGVFGAPLTGRISDFIPFLPFSPIEQAAVADKYLSDFGQELTKPVDTCEEPARYRPVGNVDLQVKRGYSVCRALAEQGYVQELGARSIINTIDREVRMPLSKQYLATRDEVLEAQPAGSFVVGVDAESGEVEVSQCAVDMD